MATSLSFPDVNAAAHASGLGFLESLLPGGRLHGREYVCGDLTGGPGQSLSVNTDTGMWCDFATGDKGGDLVSLYAAVHGLGQGEALRALAGELGLSGGSRSDIARLKDHQKARQAECKRPEWVVMMPEPDDAPAPNIKQGLHGKLVAVWQYLNGDGKVLGYTARFEDEEGKKCVLPYTYCQNSAGCKEWRTQAFPEPRPLYGLDKLAKANVDANVLLVEGEKTADAASRLFGPDIVCMTWPGGSNAVGKVDLSPLDGRHVAISPDADAPGFKAALGLADLLKAAGAASMTIIVSPAEVKQGWDLADAEDEGWDSDKLGEWMQDNMVTPEKFKGIGHERFGIEAKPSATVEAKLDQVDTTPGVIDAEFERVGSEPEVATAEGKAVGTELAIVVPTVGNEEPGQAKNPQYVAALHTLNTVDRRNLIHTKGSFWRWRGSGVWCRIEDIEIKQLIQRREAESKHLTGGFVRDVMTLVQNEVYRPEHEFDRDQRAINCLNGELHWTGSEFELRPHHRESFRTTQIPVIYDPKAQAPRFEEFLNEVFRDDPDREDKFVLVCEAFGYSLMSTCEFEKFILLNGSGANGKSVLMDTLAGLVGSTNTTAVQPSQFENKFQRAHLHGKLVNLVTEIAEGAEIADAQLKAMVSGERTTAEHKLKPPFDFYPICTCWFGTNHMPHTRDFSEGMFRRAIILPFNRTFSATEQDKKLKDKLRAELPGILNLGLMAMAGVFERNDFTTPPSCEAAKMEWRIEADQAAQFVEDCCSPTTGHKETSSDMYQVYRAWAGSVGIHRTLNQKNFTDRMCKLGAEKGKGTNGMRMLWGFRLTKYATFDGGISGGSGACLEIIPEDTPMGSSALRFST